MPRNQKTSALVMVLAAVVGMAYTVIAGNTPLLGLDLQGGEELVRLSEQLRCRVCPLEVQVGVILPVDADAPWSWIDFPAINCGAWEQ